MCGAQYLAGARQIRTAVEESTTELPARARRPERTLNRVCEHHGLFALEVPRQELNPTDEGECGPIYRVTRENCDELVDLQKTQMICEVLFQMPQLWQTFQMLLPPIGSRCLGLYERLRGREPKALTVDISPVK
jgi:hypothetical protein